MGMNIRWSHFILFLVLVLGGYSGLWGQSSEEPCGTDPEEPCARPEGLPASIAPSSKNRKTTTGKKSAICYRVNPETGKIERQSGCTVYLYNGAIYPSGGHQDGLDSKGILRKHTRGRTAGQSIPGPKSPAGTRADSISVISSTEKMVLVSTPNITLGGKPLSVAQVGTYQGTDGFPFEIKPSQVGQEEWVIACNGPPNPRTNAGNCKGHNFDVKYSDLKNYEDTIKANSKIMISWGQTGTHPSNHYGTSFLTERITKIAQEYHKKFSCYKEYDPIAINDMALPYGGVFDVYNDWRGPHYSHHRGKAVDIRCKPVGSNSVIHTKDHQIIDEFLEICDKHGLVYSEHELVGQPGEHCHCGINGDGE